MSVTATDLFVPFAVVAKVEKFSYPAVQAFVVEMCAECVMRLLDTGMAE